MEKKLKETNDAEEMLNLDIKSLMAINGGEDIDMDEDCYVAQCVLGTTACHYSVTECTILV
nr:hypothetical protein [uncultured Bacteroides sp.]